MHLSHRQHKPDQQREGKQGRYGVTNSHGCAECVGRYEDEHGADRGHEQRRQKCDDVGLAITGQIDGDGPEGEDGKGLITPAEIAPDDVESVSITDVEKEQSERGGEKRYADVQAAAHGLLF